MMEELKCFLSDNLIPFECSVPLNKRTWLKTGGIAGIFVTPRTLQQLSAVSEFLNRNAIPYELIGHTSNIYYLDSYSPGVVISTANLRNFEDNDNCIDCNCGTPVSVLSRYCIKKGYKGYYGLINLPGTVGAAICNNSSCFDCSLSELLVSLSFLDKSDNTVKVLTSKDFSFSFRDSRLKRGEIQGVILNIKLKKEEGNKDEEQEKAKIASRTRKATQEPPAYTLGSCFANLKAKPGLQLTLYKVVRVILRRIHLDTMGRLIILQLFLYGFYDLRKYVSPRNINTFKWLPDCNDRHQKFLRYCKFINKAYEHPRLEIEIRGE